MKVRVKRTSAGRLGVNAILIDPKIHSVWILHGTRRRCKSAKTVAQLSWPLNNGFDHQHILDVPRIDRENPDHALVGWLTCLTPTRFW